MRPVALPAVATGDATDAQAARHRAALVQANRRLAAAANCQARVRSDYGKR